MSPAARRKSTAASASNAKTVQLDDAAHAPSENPIAPNMADPAILEKIDTLFAMGVGRLVPLPQIVVVGDQSSGESSVLEGLTGLPFPRNSGLCTKFATHVTLLRGPVKSITISIIPDKSATDQHQQAVKAWGLHDDTWFGKKSFAAIMDEAHKVMGLGKKSDGGAQNTFSQDILKLEIQGPDQQHLSVIDVSGIFRVTTKGLTTKQDQIMVTTMVRGYVENKRFISLAVIPANIDIATQEILTMAEEFDPAGQRTLGVLTKPDLVDRGAEQAILDLVNGHSHRLALGWSIVRNLGQSQLNSADKHRDDHEKVFFENNAPWDSLEADRVGVLALQMRLQHILSETIRNEFPKVKAEIHEKLAMKKENLKKIGGERITFQQQIRYLLEVTGSTEYPALRFATAIGRRNEQLAEMFEEHGHSYSSLDEPKRKDSTAAESAAATRSGSKRRRDEISLRLRNDPDGLEGLEDPEDTIAPKSETAILDWLTNVYVTSRGFELGTDDNAMLAITMKIQSSNWEPIALCYIRDVIATAHGLIIRLLGLLCPESRLRGGLINLLEQQLLQQYQKAIEHVHFLLNVERAGTPTTLNQGFNDELDKNRHDRREKDMRAKAVDMVFPDGQGEKYGEKSKYKAVLLPDVLAYKAADKTVQEHEAYYKVARKRFVDNVCMHSADYFLVTGPAAPLKLFSPTFVGRLTEEDLLGIAKEDHGAQEKRKALQKDIEGLKAAKKILY
ncbi:dynamin family protein [Tothia fuscella]|uniref:Dynamin family protein n=1 Tax=Tothia fuscella TaxID=1048955 RepID=A0A9P4U2T9_9PEZI|nr:dynamin family protein [Tothia fuscella]